MFDIRRTGTAAIGWLMLGAAFAVEPTTAPTEDARLHDAEVLGARLYRHDNAAAIATDEARTLPTFESDRRIRGWVTEEHPGGIAVTFTDIGAAALYRVDIPADDDAIGDLMSFETPRAPTPYEAAAVNARRIAVDSSTLPCRGRYNVVVLPAALSGLDAWSVYFLPAVAERTRIPLGGAFRIDVNGGKAGPPHAYSQSCIELDNRDDAVALMVSHLLDPVPTEIHVFWNLWAEKPLAVVTDDGRTWMIEDGKIRLLAARTQ